MNIIEGFNRTMDYLEDIMDKELDGRIIGQLSGYSYAMFSRIFSIMTDLSLKEYIRYRKLTLAAMELKESNLKIIDAALKYGYESPDSFTTAFKNFHGITPTDLRNGKPMKVFNKMKLTLKVRGGNSMEVKIMKKSAFAVAGLNEESIEPKECPAVWEKLHSKYSEEKLAALGNKTALGVCHDMKEMNRINYMAGYHCSDIEKARGMGLDVLEVEEAEYAVVKLVGPMPESICAGWKFVMEEFFPENGYKHSGAPDFEVYTRGNMRSDNYTMELWVPIVKDR